MLESLPVAVICVAFVVTVAAILRRWRPRDFGS